MRVRSSASLVLLVMAVSGCASAPPSPEAGSTDRDDSTASQDPEPEAPSAIETVASLLVGRFDSTAQAARDSRYFGVSLRACPVTLGAFADTALYVEQAMVDSLDAPYRQRVYVLEATEDRGVVSNVFELKTPGRFVGLCDDTTLQAPTVDDLIARDGCAVALTEQDGAYVGGTSGKGCASTLNGASYATSEVTLTATQIRSWDRGFDDGDQQVWGAQAGPYEFDRQE